ncbi:MAG: N-6 DNA methylase [Candidatus Omnitrophica bacterium]|nr:N-6 DNA methylase [Candidatus Omnitrophota bacterium]
MKKQKEQTKEINFEDKLWKAADKMRNNMDAAEYKHIVLGLIFLKYISDAFEERYKTLDKEVSDKKGAYYVAEPQAKYETLNDPDEYRADNVFYVPEKARWEYLQKNAKQPIIGKIIDDAMDELEKNNPTLKGVLPKNYARPSLDKTRLGELIDLIGTIGLGDRENRSKDILGRVYEYFLGQFADAEGKKGGQFYTPRSIVKLLVEMLEPYKGRVFDPCCGSGGMFVQSEKFVQIHGGRIGDISVYGQESNQTTWRLCKMNLAIRGIDANIQWNNEGSFLKDAHKDLKSDFVIANPPFNDSDWKGEALRDDARWKYGAPPTGNANFAWVQHFIYHLTPSGVAGFVLANGSMSSNTSGEGEIRKNIVEADLVDCIVALPNKLFYNTGIPACLWFISRDKNNSKYRDRKGEILLIDATKMGHLIDRRHRELSDEEIKNISETYHNWKNKDGKYRDIDGFSKSVLEEDLRIYDYVLTPGLYVHSGISEIMDKSFIDITNDINKKLVRRKEGIDNIQIKLKLRLKEIASLNFDEVSFLAAQNHTLESLGFAIYKKWFIDFEFPDNQNKPYKSNNGKTKESELGAIPEKWEVKTITQCGKVICGKTPPTKDKENYGEDIPFITIPDMRNKIFVVKTEKKLSQKGANIQKKKELPSLSVCVSCIATPGLVCLTSKDSHTNQQINSIVCNKNVSPYFMYYAMKVKSEQIKVFGQGGTATLNLNTGNFGRIRLIVPDEIIMRKFDDIMKELFTIIKINAKDNTQED